MKKWVVRVGNDYKYIASQTKEGAERAALNSQYGRYKYKQASARLATPRDLGIFS